MIRHPPTSTLFPYTTLVRSGVGYQAYDLVEAVRNILGLRQTYNIALVGAGNLGSAIAASTMLPKRGFVIHDVFDNDPEKIGRTGGNVRSEEHTSELQSHSEFVCRLLL